MKTKKSLKTLSFTMCLVLIFLTFSVLTYATDFEEPINSEVSEAPLASASGEQMIGTPAPEEEDIKC